MPTSFEGHGFSGHIPPRTLVPISLRRLSSGDCNIILLTHCDNLPRNDLPTYVLLFWISHETTVNFYMLTSFEGHGFSGHIPRKTLVPISLRRLSPGDCNIILPTHCDNLPRNDLPTYVLLFWISHETIVNFYMPTSFEGYGFSGHIPQRTLVPIILRRLSSGDCNIILLTHCPASRTTLVATRFRVAVICPIIQVPHCIRVFFYFVWFVFINHIFQFYYELCTYCNILDIYLS